MALAIDGSGPAIAVQTSTTVATVTTASFTAPSGALLVAMWSADTVFGADPAAPSISDTGGLTWTQRQWRHRSSGTPTVDGQVAVWTAVTVSAVSRTVTVTTGTASGSREAALDVLVFTDTATPGVGTSGAASANTGTSATSTYTGTANGAWGLLAVCDFDLNGTQTAGTGMTVIGSADIATSVTYGFHRRTTADGTSGGSTTVAATLPSASANYEWVYLEVTPNAGGAAAIPYRQPAAMLAPVAARTAWLQRIARVDQSSAANPLVAPLLRPTSALWSRPSAQPVQRIARVDQSSAAPAGIPGPVPAPTWRRDQTVDRQRRTPAVDLTTALLETPPAPRPTPTIRGTSQAYWTQQRRPVDQSTPAAPDYDVTLAPARWPASNAVTRTDRWTRPLRPTVDPSAVPDVFDPTLSGTTTARLTPVTHAPRTGAGRQLVTPSPPDDVQVAGTRVAGAWWGVDDTIAYLGQRRALVDVSTPAGPDTDPTLSGGTRQAWWQRDRWARPMSSVADASSAPLPDTDPTLLGRAVRAVAERWSRDRWTRPTLTVLDASTPTPPDTDPTTTGIRIPVWRRDPWWRVVAPLVDQSTAPAPDADPTLLGWLPRQTATLWPVDRRLVPRQRPALDLGDTPAPADVPGGRTAPRAATHVDRTWLRQIPRAVLPPDTALLEDPLLGGAQALVTARTWPFARRSVPTQLRYPELLLPAALADPLLIIGQDVGRRMVAATHYPRWVLRLQIRVLEFVGVPAPTVTPGVMVQALSQVPAMTGAGAGVPQMYGTTTGTATTSQALAAVPGMTQAQADVPRMEGVN